MQTPRPAQNASFPWLALVFLIVILGVAGYFYYHGTLGPSAPANAPFVMQSETGAAWWLLSGTTLVKTNPPLTTHIGYQVMEAAPTLPIGTPVIVGPTSTPIFVGFADQKGILDPFITDNSDIKRNLSERADGVIAFSYFVPDAPRSGNGKWNVGAVNPLATPPALIPLGEGTGPVFLPNGDILALAPEGLVEIQPDGTRTTAIGAPYGYAKDPGIFSLSPDGKYAVLPNQVTEALDVFSVIPTTPLSLSYLGSLPSMPLALGFENGQLIVQIDGTHAGLYSFSASAITPGAALTIAQ